MLDHSNPPTLGVLICPFWSLSSLCVPPLSRRCLRCAFHRCPRCLLAQVPRCAKEPEKGILCVGTQICLAPPPNLLHTAYVSCTVAWESDTRCNFRWGNTPALVLSVGRSNVLVVPPPLKRVGDGRKPYNNYLLASAQYQWLQCIHNLLWRQGPGYKITTTFLARINYM